jgi:predicted helicase
MKGKKTFQEVLNTFRKFAFSEKDKGDMFERLMQRFLQTDPKYAYILKRVWLWNDFPGKSDLGGGDTGIDLVALTKDGDYWAIQCKCYQESAVIDKPAVDSFLSTSSREFKGEDLKTTGFSNRLWISTTNKWGPNATEAIRNQNPPVNRINLFELQESSVDWESLEKGMFGEKSRISDRELKAHQKEALDKTHEHFKTESRGQLIMACGTGKTFNSLRIAEKETDGKGLVLFLVPSIALLGQTLREWTAFAKEPINAVCICSDPEISRKKTKNEDSDSFSVVDLALPASTNVKDIVHQFKHINNNGSTGLTVVFSTYQSIEVISKAQKELEKEYKKFGEFDLIICDEAHRTTGVALAGVEESAFMKVHNNEFLKSKKRLYMTATPRLYNDDTKGIAAKAEAFLCSMDDEKLFGKEIYHIGFGTAVEKGLLTDYKVLILTLSEKDIPPAVQRMLANEGEIESDDAAKLIGCINALSKQMLGDAGVMKDMDPEPMRRAVAFCQKIIVSKKITSNFNTATEAYISSLPDEKKEEMVSVNSKHIDGTMSAPERDELLGWLKEGGEKGECRVLTNVRCLSEGVDVPSLDSVMFLSARNSQVDVVQSVGRVMRLAPGKKYGYIIIPVVVPADIEADKALDNNERYRVVWTVLNALRAHDDRFNAIVNKIELNKNRPSQILVGRPEYSFDSDGSPIAHDPEASYGNKDLSNQLALQFEQLQHVVFARMVQKVGGKQYWEQWARSVGDIAERQAVRINRLINEDVEHKKAFEDFLGGLQKNINPSISQNEAVEMLSQHIITKPVFEALFDGYSFVKNNPISVSMQLMLDLLEEHVEDNDIETLQKFYESVKTKASGIDNAEGKQRIIIELYDKFFKTAFPTMVERLGIVYTPVEVVDFVIHSVNDVLKKEFGRSISDENIHILDPFTGTGTFVTRLIQSGLINKKDLSRKYQNEIHANEIVLLAYYIAAVNIENAFHDAMGAKEYQAFEGICLTDTFQLGESEEGEKLFSDMFPQNSDRVAKQKKSPLRVIIGNPPYSVGQKAANDNAQNLKYKKLDGRISKTYAAETDATNKNSLYNSYIKAFRWSTDRLDIEHGGIVCFVTDGGWISNNSHEGFRKCLEKEFSSIYVFNLRGNARTRGEPRRREAGNVFGSGSKTPITITLLVKNPKQKEEKAIIHYKVIGDYLSSEQKISIVKDFQSIENPKMIWEILAPNEYGDWISQRNNAFDSFIPIGNKDASTINSFFVPLYSRGLASARDSWCYNSSEINLEKNIRKTIAFFNEQGAEYIREKKKNPNLTVDNFVCYDSAKISWNRGFKQDIGRGKSILFNEADMRIALYRPFFKQHLYFSRQVNDMVYQLPKLYPPSFKNIVLCISGASIFISELIPDLHLNGDTQCFPLYYYEEREKKDKGLFDDGGDSESVCRDGVSDFILDLAQNIYGKIVNKEDVFYYVYGFLHSHEYVIKFENDLKKMLPRLPLVEEPKDFWKFSKAGRALAELHINYEKVPAYQGVKVTGGESGFFKVEKMRFPKKDQKDTIIYNSKIIIENIPAEAYEYVVNGKSAIEWIMERYQVTTNKDSGLKNDPNDWAEEVGNPRYILDLLLSIITVSIETLKIVRSLPALKEIIPA